MNEKAQAKTQRQIAAQVRRANMDRDERRERRQMLRSLTGIASRKPKSVQ